MASTRTSVSVVTATADITSWMTVNVILIAPEMHHRNVAARGGTLSIRLVG